MHITSFEEFKELAQRGTFVPVYKEIVADMLTPVSAFLKVAEHSDYAFLLESVEGGEQVGRYSFLGKDPFLILRSRGGKCGTSSGATSSNGLAIASSNVTHCGSVSTTRRCPFMSGRHLRSTASGLALARAQARLQHLVLLR